MKLNFNSFWFKISNDFPSLTRHSLSKDRLHACNVLSEDEKQNQAVCWLQIALRSWKHASGPVQTKISASTTAVTAAECRIFSWGIFRHSALLFIYVKTLSGHVHHIGADLTLLLRLQHVLSGGSTAGAAQSRAISLLPHPGKYAEPQHKEEAWRNRPELYMCVKGFSSRSIIRANIHTFLIIRIWLPLKTNVFNNELFWLSPPIF